jgi:hypothetical protein
MAELVGRFHLNVDHNSLAYRTLGLAALGTEVRDMARVAGTTWQGRACRHATDSTS